MPVAGRNAATTRPLSNAHSDALCLRIGVPSARKRGKKTSLPLRIYFDIYARPIRGLRTGIRSCGSLPLARRQPAAVPRAPVATAALLKGRRKVTFLHISADFRCRPLRSPLCMYSSNALMVFFFYFRSVFHRLLSSPCSRFLVSLYILGLSRFILSPFRELVSSLSTVFPPL